MKSVSYSKNKIICISILFIFVAALIISLYSKKIANNSEIALFHIILDFFAVIETIIIYFGLCSTGVYKEKRLSCFLMAIMANAVCCFTCGKLWISDENVNLITVRYILYYLQYAAEYISTGAFMMFFMSMLPDNDEKNIKVGKRDLVIYIVFGLIIAALLATGNVFSIDSEGKYHKEDLDFAPSLVTLIFCALFLIINSKKYGFKTVIAQCKKTFLFYVSLNLIIFGWLIVSPYYEPTSILICCSALMIYCMSYSDMLKYNRFLNNSFKKYVSSEDAEKAAIDKSRLTIGSERISVSIMMCSLRGFDDVVKSESPERSAEMLNHFFGDVAGTIEKNRGTVLGMPRYSILSVFGAPERYEGYAECAVDAALEIKNRIKEINAWNKKKGFPAISVGMGISTGETIIGNIGSENHMRYSAISRMVNLSSRLESFSKDNEIIITEFTKNACKNIETDEGNVSYIKGYSGKVPFYSLYGRVEL